MLVVTSSSKLQVHIHKKIVSSLISLILHDRGGYYGVNVHSMDISSIIDVNSLVMCSIFPNMAQFSDERDVIFGIKVSSVDFSLNNEKLRFILDLKLDVATHNTI